MPLITAVFFVLMILLPIENDTLAYESEKDQAEKYILKLEVANGKGSATILFKRTEYNEMYNLHDLQ